MATDIGELVTETKVAGKRKAFRRVDDGTDALPEMARPLPPVVTSRGPALEGVPSVEDDPVVIDLRAKYAAVRADLDAADTLVSSLSSELGLPANTTRGRIEATMVDLLSTGKPVEKIAQLEAAALKARLLRAAAEKAYARIQPAVETATRAACTVAHEKMYKPAERLLAERLLAFMADVRDFRKTVNILQGAGLHGAVQRTVPALLTVDTESLESYALRAAIEGRQLSRAEVREALPELTGI